MVGHEIRDFVKSDQDAPNGPQQTSSHYSENGKLPHAKEPQEVQSETSKRKKRKKRKTSGDDYNVEGTGKRNNWSVARVQCQRHTPVESERKSRTSSKDTFEQNQTDKIRKRAERADCMVKRRVKRDASHSLRLREQSPHLLQLPGPDIGDIPSELHPRWTNTSTRVAQGLGAGRLAVRHRYIQHKKMCMMDNKALNEVCIALPVWWDHI